MLAYGNLEVPSFGASELWDRRAVIAENYEVSLLFPRLRCVRDKNNLRNQTEGKTLNQWEVPVRKGVDRCKLQGNSINDPSLASQLENQLPVGDSLMGTTGGVLAELCRVPNKNRMRKEVATAA